MIPEQKIDKLKQLCDDYREHLLATKSQYTTDHAAEIHNKKLKALDELRSSLYSLGSDFSSTAYYTDERYKDEKGRTKSFGELRIESFGKKLTSARIVLGAHREIDPAGVLFLKAVATVLSLGTVLLYNNFWKSKGEQESDKMQKVLNEPLEIPSVRDGIWLGRQRLNDRSKGFMGQLVEAFRSSPQ